MFIIMHTIYSSQPDSALQEMPERYWSHEERGNSHLILWREFAARCVNFVRGDPSITNEDTARLLLVLKRNTFLSGHE